MSWVYVMMICHASIGRVMHVPAVSLGVSFKCVMWVCHGGISLGFRICHVGMSWEYVMRICHACIRGVMHDPEMSLAISCRCVMQVCHGDL